MLSDTDALALADEPLGHGLDELLAAARRVRHEHHGIRVTYSPKVFIPLTMLCRDVCHYCTFARPPKRGERVYLTVDEAIAIAREGAEAGCREALFTLGDKPELRYRAAREELAALGFETTAAYLAHVAGEVLRETGLLPHANPGVLDDDELLALREVCPSQGIMLETTSDRLSQRGGPHFGSPDKLPSVRIDAIGRAGRLQIPYTSGILIGIGETRRERVEALLALRDLHLEHGHVQEVIVQNFRAKADTKMANAPEPTLDDHLWTIAVARLVLPPEVSLQAPPNLADDEFAALLSAGIDDFGGVSPVTPDHVNPEAPWPDVARLEDACAASGLTLLPRLAVYPRFLADPERWLSDTARGPSLAASDGLGLARREHWSTGTHPEPPPAWRGGRRPQPVGSISPAFARALERSEARTLLDEDDATALLSARGPEVELLASAADRRRLERAGDRVTYVVCRNVNYTNVCYFRCGFCAFSKGKLAANLRGPAYLLSVDEVARRAVEAWERGGTEVCLQGGIHPGFTGRWYLDLLRAVKEAVPSIHVHAFSPLEVWQGAATAEWKLADYLTRLKDAGLGSLPGTAAEILDDDVRRILCPDKVSTSQWLEVMRTAHGVGLRSTATMMFGHIENPRNQAKHLLAVRDLQRETGGFTEFVPLPFVADEAPIALRGRARSGPTFEEVVVVHAAARLLLDPWIPHIQASWVKLGPEGARALLAAGVDDLGGTLMNESITRAAGAVHGQECPPEVMEAAIIAAGREPSQRTTLYAAAPEGQVAASFGAAELEPTPVPPYDDAGLERPRRLIRPGLVGVS
ncbi:MAG TPA: 5-amino-6-(D-ribitylamino)uracil--L-tyrosine 4-hydroxyphenyl transferase CofH [Gaiellales bacterium]